MDMDRTQTLATDLSGGDGPGPVPAAGEPPAALGGWVRGRRLGMGGMGAVYEATREGVRAALKVLRPGALEHGDFRARFEREVAVMRRIRHPHVVGLIDAGVDAGWPWMALEYMPSGDLAAHLKRRGQLFEKEALLIAIQLAEALEALHAEGLIHRDIKPANIFLDKTRGAQAVDVRLGDLGMARASDGADRMTMTGTACGTPAYMAPEQVRGIADQDARVDLYAVGTTLFTALTGHEPFSGDTIYVVTHAVLTRPLPNIRSANPQVSDGLVAIIGKLCAKERGERYQSAGELRADLERLRDGRQLLHVAPPSATRIFEEVAGSPAPRPAPAAAAAGGASGGGGGLLADLDWGRILRLGVPAVVALAALAGLSAWMGSRGGPAVATGPAPVPASDAGGTVAAGRLLGVPVRFRWVAGAGGAPPFWMLEDEVAGDLWTAVVGGTVDDPALPVAAVSWEEAEGLVAALATRVPGLAPRLPSEDEWDRAAAQAQALDPEAAVEPPADILAWWAGQGPDAPSLPELRLALARAGHAVRPQPTGRGGGLRHLGGNLQEWVLAQQDGGAVPVLRGGSVVHPAAARTPATRHEVADTTGEPWVGMRFVLPGIAPDTWPAGLERP
jgi:hypothetical protein